MLVISSFLNANPIIAIFICILLGYLVGSIRIAGIGLGSSGVLVVALIMGHFEVSVPTIVQNIGLALFVASVGFGSGPTFFSNFKKNGLAYIIVAIATIASSVAVGVLIIKVFSLDTDITLGLLSGALTTTPGLATAVEVTGSSVVPVGYGIAYPFGVISVVLFVQIMFKHISKEHAYYDHIGKKENYTPTKSKTEKETLNNRNMFLGLLPLSAAIALGCLLGRVVVNLPGGATFSLGTSGGPLITGIVFGWLGNKFNRNILPPKETISVARELGLVLFLLGAGMTAGKGFYNILMEQGLILLAYGAMLSIVPLIVGFVLAFYVFKLNIINSLGAVCGGMTSTPALGTLIRVSGTETVSNAYAATYPFALISIVLLFQIVGIIF